GAQDELFLGVLQESGEIKKFGCRQGKALAMGTIMAGRGRFPLRQRQIVWSDLKIAGENVRALNQVAQLAQISRKAVLPQVLQGGRAQVAAGHLQLGGNLLAEQIA